MGILSWILIGLFVGFLTSMLSKMGGRRMMTVVLASLFGAAIGGLDVAILYRTPGAFNTFHWAGMMSAMIGAFLMVTLVSLLSIRKRPAR